MIQKLSLATWILELVAQLGSSLILNLGYNNNPPPPPKLQFHFCLVCQQNVTFLKLLGLTFLSKI